jgi:hypothetical protein
LTFGWNFGVEDCDPYPIVTCYPVSIGSASSFAHSPIEPS